MAISDVIAGLDLGSSRIVAIVGRLDAAGSIVVTGVGEQPAAGIRRGAIIDIGDAAGAIEEAVSEAARQAGVDVESVYVGISGDHVRSLISSARVAVASPDHEVTAGDIGRVLHEARAIVLPPDREVINVSTRSYTLDGQNGVRRPAGMTGIRLEMQVHIAHGSGALMHNVDKCIGQAHLEVMGHVLSGFAAGDSCLFEAEKELGACLVDIGAGTTDVAVFMDGAIQYCAALSIGAEHVTRDIAIAFGLAMETAERLKLEHATALPEEASEASLVPLYRIGRDTASTVSRRKMAEIVEARMSEIFQMVADELKAADCLQRIPAGLVLTGGGANLRGCAELAEKTLGIPVRVGAPHELPGLGPDLSRPEYAAAVGILEHGGRAANEPAIEPEAVARPARTDGMARAFTKLKELFGV